MANQLDRNCSIDLHLHSLRWSGRRIAAELHVDRETVSRYVRLARESAQADQPNSKPVNSPIGSPARRFKPGQCADFRPGTLALSKPASTRSGPASDCEPWREVIEAEHDQGLSAKRIHQDLVGEHQATVSYLRAALDFSLHLAARVGADERDSELIALFGRDSTVSRMAASPRVG